MKLKNREVKLNDVRLNSVSYPLWLLLFVPILWLVFVPSNFLFDCLVLFVCMKIFKLDNKKEMFQKFILKIFSFGLVAKIFGALCLFLMSYVFDLGIKGSELYLTIPVLLLTGALIFVFNYYFTFKNVDKSLRLKLSLIFAIATAPFIFVLPITFS